MESLYPESLDYSNLRPIAENQPAMRFFKNEAFNDANPLDRFIAIDSVHGGDSVPMAYWHLFENNKESKEAYIREKDWGANHVAYELSKRLNLSGFHKVEIARALLDYNRFPGVTPPGVAAHLNRLCINKPISNHIAHQEIRSLLSNYYDAISSGYEQFARKALLKISIHTYDTYNPGANTKRPATSVLYRALDYQENSQMPYGVFDKLFIDELIEFTGDRRLVNRLGLTLEKANVAMSYNYPYLLPAGCIEVRAQVWRFFNYFKSCFETDYPDTVVDENYQGLWRMLMDTNFRDGDSQILRSYIHAYRHPPRGYEQFCEKANDAYRHLTAYMEQHRKEIRRSYRYHPYRLSCIGIEVRKDLVWDFETMKPKSEAIQRISGLIAEGIMRYFEEDHAHRDMLGILPSVNI